MTHSKAPLISILTASYNYAHFIEKTIESVLNQTYKNWELLIIDDGSTDNSVEIIKKYTQNHKNIRLLQHKNNENKGLSETLQLGLKNAKGKYIAFLESDDYWTNDNLEKKVEYLNKYPEAKTIYTDIEMFGDENQINILQPHVNRCRLLSKKITKPENISKYFIITTTIPTFSCMIVEKKLLKKCNFNSPIKPYLDWWIGAQLTYLSEVFYINERLTYWQIHPQSYIGRIKKNITRVDERNFKNSLLINLKKLDKKKYPIFLAQALEYKQKIYDLEMLEGQKTNLLKSIEKKKIYLYGAGIFAEKILKDNLLANLNILGIIDGNKNKKGSTLYGIEIFHKDEIEKLKPEVIIMTLAEPNLLYFDLTSYLLEKRQNTYVIPNLFHSITEKDFSIENPTIEKIITDLIT